jgi:cation transport ATPase
VTGIVDGRTLAIGNRRFLDEIAVETVMLDVQAETLRQAAATVAFVAIDGKAAGIFGPVRLSRQQKTR